MDAFRPRMEWEIAPGVVHPVLARTWARFELSIGEVAVTEVSDARAGATRTGVYGPMFPIAEWAVRNFWFLLAERTPVAPSAAWLRRHSLAAAREGNSLPDLRLHSDDGVVIAEWYADERLRTGRPVRFVASGSEEPNPAAVHQQLVELVDSILDRVRDLVHPDVLALRADWNTIASASGDELKLCKRAARMGLDAYEPAEVSESLERALLEGLDGLPELMQGDMLDAAVGAQRFESSLALIRHALGSASLGSGKPDAALPRMESGQRAHEQGYALARAVRERVKQGTCTRLDLDGALDALQWKGLRVLRDDWSSLDRNVKAAVGFSSGVPRVLAALGNVTRPVAQSGQLAATLVSLNLPIAPDYRMLSTVDF